MTVPSERLLAIVNARRFLRDLLDPKKTPRVPKEYRTRAYWCLRHFPSNFELVRAETHFNEIFETREIKDEDDY